MNNPFKESLQTYCSLKTRRERLQYIWDYGRLWILILVCLLGFTGFAIYRKATAVTENYLYLAFVNTQADVGTGSDFWKGLIEATGWDTKEKNVQIDASAYFSYAENQGKGNVYYEAVVSFLDAGVLDAVIMPAEDLTAFGATGRLMDLEDERCRAILKKYEDRLLYAVPLDTEYSADAVPIGIDISDSPKIEQYRIYDNSCALGIGAFCGNIDNVGSFLDYLFTEE